MGLPSSTRVVVCVKWSAHVSLRRVFDKPCQPNAELTFAHTAKRWPRSQQDPHDVSSQSRNRHDQNWISSISPSDDLPKMTSMVSLSTSKSPQRWQTILTNSVQAHKKHRCEDFRNIQITGDEMNEPQNALTSSFDQVEGFVGRLLPYGELLV